jgi:hypothetical protein
MAQGGGKKIGALDEALESAAKSLSRP